MMSNFLIGVIVGCMIGMLITAFVSGGGEGR